MNRNGQNGKRTLVLLILATLITATLACGGGSEVEPVASLTPPAITQIVPTVAPTAAPTIGLPMPSEPASTDDRPDDRAAIAAVIKLQGLNYGMQNLDGFYDTCHPAMAQQARDAGAVDKYQELYPNLAIASFELEDLVFTGADSAFVVFGLRWDPAGVVNGFGGGPFEKADGQWYSLGWGCF